MCQRFNCEPDRARELLALPALRPRKLGAWASGLAEISALEDAYEECTREGGKPTPPQQWFVEEVERLYIELEDIVLVYEEQDAPVLTPTDLAAQEASQPQGDEKITFG